MFDSSLSLPETTAAWQEKLSWGDIVLFRSPAGASTTPPAPRPHLVLDVETVGGRRCVILAPALLARRPAGNHRAVLVARRADYRAAGLDRPTLFSIRARLLVPLAHDGFVAPPATVSPILGRLQGAAMARMHAERARLHALRDFRADREGSRDHRPRRPIPMSRISTARSSI